MKINKNKGKVHPSPSSSSSTTTTTITTTTIVAAALKLLPGAILTLITILSLEEQEVLAYMITRSMKSSVDEELDEINKKPTKNNNKGTPAAPHRPPVFDCGCFECYTSYWTRWDSSPNRELIHQAIEAFEENETETETENQQQKLPAVVGRKGKGKQQQQRRDRNNNGAAATASGKRNGNNSKSNQLPLTTTIRTESSSSSVQEPEKEEAVLIEAAVMEVKEEAAVVVEVDEEAPVVVEVDEEAPVVVEVAEEATAGGGGGGCAHKGLARKVLLPDVIGILNSRLWGLWNPNV
ncbi:hypothetical protein Droror1_Dr00018733 [Drosera rotundifolia]